MAPTEFHAEWRDVHCEWNVPGECSEQHVATLDSAIESLDQTIWGYNQDAAANLNEILWSFSWKAGDP